MTLTIDLRPQHTPRGLAIQQADADRIAGVLHYASAVHGRGGGVDWHLAESRRRLNAATKGYGAADVPMEWFRTGRWAYQAETSCNTATSREGT